MPAPSGKVRDMRLVRTRGMTMPAIGMPGGTLLLGFGRGGVAYLMNEGDVPYRHGDMSLHLNPHFVVTPPGTVVVKRMDDGSPAGMCFHAREMGEDVRPAEREELYAELAQRLSDALLADPELAGHVERACVAEDLLDAERAFREASEALVEAGRAVVQMRIRAGTWPKGEADPLGERPAAFLVMGVPGDEEGDAAAYLEGMAGPLAETLRAGPGGPGMPLAVSLTQA